MKSSGIIYYHDWNYTPNPAAKQRVSRPKKAVRSHTNGHSSSWIMGIGMLALALGGVTGPIIPRIRLEAKYASLQLSQKLASQGDALRSYSRDKLAGVNPQTATDTSATKNTNLPAAFDPLKTPDGASIDPVNKEFSLIVPKIGINAAVIPAVNPTKPGEYLKALEKGIAHSSLSYFPDEEGTVYLFSHSTNYDWFVKDMNAVFYLLKNLEENDDIVIFYKGNAYTYRITGKQIVKPTDVAYMAPQAGAKRLILQTCWPPGSTTERLLIFADLVAETNASI